MNKKSKNIKKDSIDKSFKSLSAFCCTKDSLVLKNIKFATYMASRNYRSSSIPLEDAIMVAIYGMLKAEKKFDEKCGVKFTTFSANYILVELKDYYYRNKHVVCLRRSDIETEKKLTSSTLNDDVSLDFENIGHFNMVECDNSNYGACIDQNFFKLIEICEYVEGLSDLSNEEKDILKNIKYEGLGKNKLKTKLIKDLLEKVKSKITNKFNILGLSDI